jgi:hypothetical protein
MTLKRVLLGRLIFSVLVTAGIGAAYWLGIMAANWTAPIAGGIG